MPLREVHHVDVVPDAGAVRRLIVIPENPEVVKLPDRDLGDVWHQVVRDAVRVLADKPALMRANRVEVAEHAQRPAVIRPVEVLANLLDVDLGLPVGAGGPLYWLLFSNRDFPCRKVDGGARAEDKALHIVLCHHLKESHCSLNVVAVVHQGLLNGLAYSLVPREVDDSVNLMLSEDFPESFPVPDVGLIKYSGLTGDFLNSAENLLRAVREVVGDNDVKASAQEGDRSVTPDEPGASCYEDGAHLRISPALSSAERITLSMS